MKIHKKVTVTEDRVVESRCNHCGKSCHVTYARYRVSNGVSKTTPTPYKQFLGLSADVRGKFSSKHLRDMTKYEFDVCEKCLVEWMFKSFKIKPRVTAMSSI